MLLNVFSGLIYAVAEVDIYGTGKAATANETNTEEKKEEEKVIPNETTKEEPKPAQKKATKSVIPPIGNIEVDLKFDLPVVATTNHISLVLKDAAGQKATVLFQNVETEKEIPVTIGTQTVTASIKRLDYKGHLLDVSNAETTGYFAVTFYGLTTGTYAITASANGYKSATVSNIELTKYSKRITLSNQDGSFLCGDINQDGNINDQDAELLIAGIDTKDNNLIAQYDLNMDGNVDLVDLAYIIENRGKAVKQASIVDTDVIVDTNKITATANDEEIDIANLFDDQKETVQIAPKEAEKAVSKENPVVLDLGFEEVVQTEQIRISPSDLSLANAPSALTLFVEDEAGNKTTLHYQDVPSQTVSYFTDKADSNTIVIDLGKQVAVKKITIVIEGTKENTKLAEIAKVELLNNVYEEVPKPRFDIPLNIKAKAGSEEFDVSWSHANNVTGYEVLVEQKQGDNVLSSQVFSTSYNKITIKTLKEKELENYTTYTVSVQSVSGEWKSGYSLPVEVKPIPTRKPPAPNMVNVVGKYQKLEVSWKKMKDTLTYNIYYRERGSKENYTKISDITGNSASITDLKNEVEYELYVTGNNHLGEGDASNLSLGKTAGVEAPITPNYKLINTASGENVPTAHIKKVTYPLASTTPNFDPFDIVDHDYTSYWNVNTWDCGGYNNTQKGPIVEFDQAYTMNQIIFVSGDDEPSYYEYRRVYYWDENGVKKEIGCSLQQKTSTNGKKYYFLKTNEPITATKIQVNLALYWAGAPNARIRIAEMKFYYYDSLENDVNALFADDLHVELKEGVTQEQIDELEKRANTKDEVSGEYHPNRDILLSDIALARKILNDTAISDVITVDTSIANAKNGNLGFAMALNDFQPLGIVARAGDEIAVYVGTKGNTMPQLVFTQYYAEASQWQTSVTNLTKGQNIITVPKIGNKDSERGGSVYLRYPKADDSQTEIKVRVSGGQKIPVLDLNKKKTSGMNESQIKQIIKTYIQSLQLHVNEEMKAYYANRPTVDENGKPLSNIYAYDEKNSPLNATEIVTNNVILSVPATKAYAGIKGNNSESELDTLTNRLYQSVTAFESMMTLFYQQKGLYENPDTNGDGIISTEEAKHKMPGSRINIRYMQMFDGAFMYAGGMHIGIESGSVPGLMNGNSDKGFFGWGISHEIGHQIDEGNMIYGETSNNLFALFAQTADDTSLSRLESSGKYKDIYEKVTSGTKGLSSDVFVNLGMLWQLRLAYDNNPTLTDTESFYARLNRLYRTTSMNQVGRDDLLIRLASDVVQKDLSDFFIKWGLTPSADTVQYLKDKGYAKETKQIQYLNDAARRYRIQGGTTFSNQTKLKATLVSPENTKDITLQFGVTAESEKVLGYEIKRNGTVIAFVEGEQTSYIDHLNALNNRVFEYEVTAYDQLLNPLPTVTLDPIKVSYDGTVTPANFKIFSNVKNTGDISTEPDGPMEHSSLSNLIDGNKENYFNGNTKVSTADKSDAYVVIDLNDTMPISGIRYTAATLEGNLLDNTIRNYEIYVSENNQDWTKVKSGTMNQITAQNPEQLIYFDKAGTTGGNQLWTYNVSYVKIVAKGAKTLSGAEITVIAPPGDNVSLKTGDIGVLKTDYQYGLNETDVIPAGSVVFQGEYRGNPAFNAVLLIDSNNHTAEGTNLLFAELPDNSPVDEIASGTWLYYMTKTQYEALKGNIKANLYRVDDALNSTGQRFVSDTLPVTLPSFQDLPEVEIHQEKAIKKVTTNS